MTANEEVTKIVARLFAPVTELTTYRIEQIVRHIFTHYITPRDEEIKRLNTRIAELEKDIK